MSHQQHVRDPQTQPESTQTPGDDRVQYPEVSNEPDAMSKPVGDHAKEATPYCQERFTETDPVKPDAQHTREFEPASQTGDQRGEQPVASKQNPYVQQPEPTSFPTQQTQEGANPYVQTTSADNSPKGSSLQNFWSKWTKKAEDMTGPAGGYWTHLSTGSNMTETALGRLSLGTRVLTEGGMANVFKKTFPPTSDKEQLLKTYACYLSTSAGPISGTIFLSTERLAFVSDSPLTPTPTAAARRRGEQAGHHYKVVVPLDKIQLVNPRENPKKTTEKFVHVETNDNHEFWFMGFINYDKAVTNLQQAVKGEHVDDKIEDTSPLPQSGAAMSENVNNREYKMADDKAHGPTPSQSEAYQGENVTDRTNAVPSERSVNNREYKMADDKAHGPTPSQSEATHGENVTDRTNAVPSARSVEASPSPVAT